MQQASLARAFALGQKAVNMQNLRDKLLQAGLVSKDQATQAEAESHKPKPSRAPPAPRPPAPPRSGGGGGRPSGPMITARPQSLEHARAAGRPVESAIPKLPPMPGSKAHQRNESKKQADLDRQLRELVLANQVPLDVGATVFYFVTRKGKLRRLELSESMAKQLERGELAVVERPDPAQIEHALVPPPVAEQMLTLLPKSVRFFNRPNAPVGFLSEQDVKDHQAAPETPDEPETPDAPEGASEG